MKEINYILHLKDGNRLVTEAEAIQEAERQEKAGTVPRYAWRVIKQASRSRRLVGLCGQRMRTVAGSFIADQTGKWYLSQVGKGILLAFSRIYSGFLSCRQWLFCPVRFRRAVFLASRGYMLHGEFLAHLCVP